MFKTKPPKNKGYTLLFAVLTAILVLSIAAFILSVSRKQFILSSSARDSVYAFYAADSGLECAILNLYFMSTTTYNSTNIKCGGAQVSGGAQVRSQPVTDSNGVRVGVDAWFPIVPNSVSGAPCAWVRVSQKTENGKLVTNIDSRGYNIGWNVSEQNCNTYGPRKVERGIGVTLTM